MEIEEQLSFKKHILNGQYMIISHGNKDEDKDLLKIKVNKDK